MDPNKLFLSSADRAWSDLPLEILFVIISSLFILDRVRCRLVCRSWAEAERLKQPPHQLPWLMLSPRPDSASRHSFFSPTGATMVQVRLPEELQESMCCGSIDDRLVFSDKSCTTFLFNPFSKSLTHIPQKFAHRSVIQINNGRRTKQTTHFLRKVIFSAPPDNTSDDCQVAAIYDRSVLFYGPAIITNVFAGRDDFIVEDILFDRTKTNLWAITIHEDVYELIEKPYCSGHVNFMVEKRVRQEYDLAYKKHVYLVQFCGSHEVTATVMILRYYEGECSDESTVMFKVYELILDGIEGKWVEINSLKGHVIFVSSSCSRAITASKYQGLEDDTIYFADDIRYANDPSRDRYESGDIGVFSLKDESITRLVEDRVNSSHLPAAWFFHLNEW